MDLFGRSKIYINKNKVSMNSEDEIKEMILALKDCFVVHRKNKKEIQYLYDYVRGNQDILNRQDKKIRPEINYKISLNQAKHIVDFKKGYIFSEPIQYIKNSNKSQLNQDNTTEDQKDTQLLLINEYAQEAGKLDVDKSAGFWAIVCGVGYAICLANKEENSNIPFTLHSLDPRNTFICYSSDFTKEPLVGVTYFEEENYKVNKTYIEMTIYTKTHWIECKVNDEFTGVEILNMGLNVIGMLPIVEYEYNETLQGAFEPVVPLLNALNTLTSDRMNDVAQSVQWFIKFINCEITAEQYDELRARGLLLARQVDPGMPVDVDAVTTNLDQEQIQVLADFIYQQILEITNVPDRNASSGGNTGNALVIGQGWTGAETDAKSVETLLEKSQKQLLRIILKICKMSKKSNPLLNNCYAEEINIKFTRNKTDNLLVKTQALAQLLGTGVAPLLAFELCGLFSDPQKAYELSKETLAQVNQNREPLKEEDPTKTITDPNQKIAEVY